MINYLWLKWRIFKTHFWGEENGAVGLIEIVILIAIVIALALAFRKEIIRIIKEIFGDMPSTDEITQEIDLN